MATEEALRKFLNEEFELVDKMEEMDEANYYTFEMKNDQGESRVTIMENNDTLSIVDMW